jgi:dipeptidase E
VNKEVRIALGGGGEAPDERLVLDVFGSWVGHGRVLYIPIAMDGPYEPSLEWARGTSFGLGGVTDIVMASTAGEVIRELPRSDAAFIGGGNTYSLLDRLRASGADKVLRRSAEDGLPVYGGSAGAILLGRDIGTARHADPNYVGLTDTTGLDLALGCAISCHYLPSDDPRIRKYVSETGHSVIAMPERGGVVRTGESIQVVGPESVEYFSPSGSRTFARGDLLPGPP